MAPLVLTVPGIGYPLPGICLVYSIEIYYCTRCVFYFVSSHRLSSPSLPSQSVLPNPPEKLFNSTLPWSTYSYPLSLKVHRLVVHVSGTSSWLEPGGLLLFLSGVPTSSYPRERGRPLPRRVLRSRRDQRNSSVGREPERLATSSTVSNLLPHR